MTSRPIQSMHPYQAQKNNTRLAIQLASFISALFFGGLAIGYFITWMKTPGAPQLSETRLYQVNIKDSQLEQWRNCTGRGFAHRCIDQYRLCLRSPQLPSPQSIYCFTSTHPISPAFEQLTTGIEVNVHLAPKLDTGRKIILRFWQLEAEGFPMLSMERISEEHNNENRERLQSSFALLLFSGLSLLIYRYTRRKGRM